MYPMMLASGPNALLSKGPAEACKVETKLIVVVRRITGCGFFVPLHSVVEYV